MCQKSERLRSNVEAHIIPGLKPLTYASALNLKSSIINLQFQLSASNSLNLIPPQFLIDNCSLNIDIPSLIIARRNPAFELKEITTLSRKAMESNKVGFLLSDPTKAKEKLGWQADYSVVELAREMVESDFKKLNDIS